MEYAVHNINQSLVGGATDSAEEYQSQLTLYLTEVSGYTVTWHLSLPLSPSLSLPPPLHQMKDIRQQLKQVEYTEYQLVKTIIGLWREIKQLRQTQQYSSTNVQVTLHK